MRGKVARGGSRYREMRITPAYAGKSYEKSFQARPRQDHPRICGEKLFATIDCPPYLGSPPHMRGKASGFFAAVCVLGITPAYAGKSIVFRFLCHLTRDHPRICGEKRSIVIFTMISLGSPPHMRGKGEDFPQVLEDCGITPAYAGKRGGGHSQSGSEGDHPRICGEKTKKIP